MYFPTTRVLTVLELLQSRTRISGPELAERLEVDVRTVRRYVTMLQSMGIPVQGGRGRYGAYFLRPGFKLPPLMFTNEEALALTLGLFAARKLGLAEATPSIEGVAAKVERVLPLELRESMQALQNTLEFHYLDTRKTIRAEIISVLSTAAQLERRVHLSYQAFKGDISEREVDPYGLVYRVGYWYMAGYCHLRKELRSFRLDRILDATMRAEHFTRPTNFNCLEYVTKGIPMTPARWYVEVILETTLEEARTMVPPARAVLEQVIDQERQVLFKCYVDELDWLAHSLASLECPFIVRQPDELRDALFRQAERMRALAEHASSPQ
ncbi:helix-turn-helix transcriptional regulator [Ktedonospora formicarum]|uniref:Transcriptional regulator n=1 Tax=Ktedonospora formicarum TaxID=2778364 RepID=A0A8J3I4U4_9CHLR|nr:YafY family protein [Ktedonospora formicarum]GHO44814.1 transcriptional regulator [Ktedonospora formicarum]